MSFRESEGLVRAFFWLAAVALFLAIVLGLSFWGCTRKKHSFMPGVALPLMSHVAPSHSLRV